MRCSYVVVFASQVFSLHCESPAPQTRDSPTPVHALSASGNDVRPAVRSYSFATGKAPIASFSTDEERFHLVLTANGWGDFSRNIEGLRELQLKDVRTIEIELPLSACKFAVPTTDARLHHCYYFENSMNEKPAEVRFVLGDYTVITWSDAVPGKRFSVWEGLTLVSNEEVDFRGEPNRSRFFLFNFSLMDETSSAAVRIDLPLRFDYYELP